MTLHHWPNPRVPWRSFHNHWIVRLVEYLNQGVLPEGFQARPTESIIGIEPDALLLHQADQPAIKEPAPQWSALDEATLTAVLPPPAEMPVVGIYSAYDTSRLVAAIELVSPGNKDRPEAVQAFVEKALLLLQGGVHLVIVDTISLPGKPVRQPILKRLNLEDTAVESSALWVSSYCSIYGEDPQPHLRVQEWAYRLEVGRPLPSVPLFLRTDQLWVMVDLQETYEATLAAGRYHPL